MCREIPQNQKKKPLVYFSFVTRNTQKAVIEEGFLVIFGAVIAGISSHCSLSVSFMSPDLPLLKSILKWKLHDLQLLKFAT